MHSPIGFLKVVPTLGVVKGPVPTAVKALQVHEYVCSSSISDKVQLTSSAGTLWVYREKISGLVMRLKLWPGSRNSKI